jgi:hypothetical protein
MFTKNNLLASFIFFMILLLFALVLWPAWLFWKLFFPRLEYWHVFVFGTFIGIGCAWISFFRAFRLKHLPIRIIEQIIVFIVLCLFVLYFSKNIF